MTATLGIKNQVSEMLGITIDNCPHCNLDMTCAVGSFVSKLPQNLDMEFRWMIRSVLGKPFICNMIRKELKAVKSLRLSNDVRIMYGDKRQLYCGASLLRIDH
jgi:hypothetical protein